MNKLQKIKIMQCLSKKIYDKFIKLTNDDKIATKQSKMFLNDESSREEDIDDSISAQKKYLAKRSYDMVKVKDSAYLSYDEYYSKYINN